MKKLFALLSTILLLGLFCPKSEAQDKNAALLALLTQMETSQSKLNDFTAVFQKQERIERVLLPEETMQLKFQKPLKVYMKWINGPHQGRQSLYVQGQYDNKVIAREPGLLGFMTFSLDPRGSVAMRNNRHPITEIGFGFVIDRLRKDIQTAIAHDELLIDRIEDEVFEGRPGIVVEAGAKPRSTQKYYASHMVLHVDKELMLPVGAEFYDKNGRLFERYAYSNVKVNPGLTPADFSRYNTAYRF